MCVCVCVSCLFIVQEIIEAKLEANKKDIMDLRQSLGELLQAHTKLEREASFLRMREVCAFVGACKEWAPLFNLKALAFSHEGANVLGRLATAV